MLWGANSRGAPAREANQGHLRRRQMRPTRCRGPNRRRRRPEEQDAISLICSRPLADQRIARRSRTRRRVAADAAHQAFAQSACDRVGDRNKRLMRPDRGVVARGCRAAKYRTRVSAFAAIRGFDRGLGRPSPRRGRSSDCALRSAPNSLRLQECGEAGQRCPAPAARLSITPRVDDDIAPLPPPSFSTVAGQQRAECASSHLDPVTSGSTLPRSNLPAEKPPSPMT